MARRSTALPQLELLSYVSNTANSLGLPVLTRLQLPMTLQPLTELSRPLSLNVRLIGCTPCPVALATANMCKPASNMDFQDQTVKLTVVHIAT
jgi:hypothetical protein